MSKSIENELYPRQDTECLILNMPKLEGEELRSYMEYKLRALYPGNGEEYEISTHLLGRSGKAAVYIREKQELHTVSKKVLPASLFPDLFRKNKGMTVLTVSHGWVDLIHCPAENHGAAESKVYTYQESSRIKGFLESRLDEIQGLQVFYSDLDFLNHILPNLEIPNLIRPTVNKLNHRRVRKAAPAFSTISHKIRLPIHLIQALFVIFIITLNLTRLYQEKLLLEHRLESLNVEYDQELNQRQEILQLESQMIQKQELWDETKRKIPGNRYNFLQDLEAIFGGKYEIQTLLISGKRFSMDLIGPDALSLKEEFNRDIRFGSIRISQVVPEEGVERFKLQGEYYD